jgi:monovalent cation/proton antiporter MnhG/PhaG subunit
MVMNIAVAIPLFAGVIVALLSAIGVMTARNAFDRMHFAGPAAVLSPILIAGAAVAAAASSTQSVLKGILLAFVFLIASPILAHATGKAFYRREQRIRNRSK